ncbi:MAG TPA: phosphoenolpyruvate--protein phosphotransferase, partial [bacterium]|nr:phosphoenolpyruvate--protein phosphotransferase [bacterium]
MSTKPEINPEQRQYTGVAASPGVAIGHAFIYDEARFWVEEKDISLDEVEHEKDRLTKAIEEVIRDIRALKYKLEQKVGKEEASIFDPHIMLLQDPAVIKETNDLIEKGKNAEFAFFRTARKIIKAYKRVEDEYMRQRIDDVTDIVRRIHTKLQGRDYFTFSNLKHKVIVIAPILSPSDTANMHSGNVKAFVTDLGGVTSHTTIIAR